MTIGNKIKSLREIANMTQQELADKMGVSRQAVTKWEKDKGIPDIDNLIKIKKIFNVTLEELVDYKIEDMHLEIDEREVKLNKKASSLKTTDKFILTRFKDADSITRLSVSKKLGFWKGLLDFIIGAGALEAGDWILNGYPYSYLIEKDSEQFIVMLKRDKMFIKKLKIKFEKNKLIYDGYIYYKIKCNKNNYNLLNKN